jgi:hypothetical protein
LGQRAEQVHGAPAAVEMNKVVTATRISQVRAAKLATGPGLSPSRQRDATTPRIAHVCLWFRLPCGRGNSGDTNRY